MTENIIVENIKCGGCINSIKTALLKIANVQKVSIDKELKTVIITSDFPFDKESIIDELSKMGYPATGNNNLRHKAKSFVSCAIGNITEKV